MLQLDAKSSLSHTQWWELLEDSQSGHFKHHWSLLTGHGEIPGNCLYPYTEVFFISFIFTIQCMLYLANLWCHLARQRRERNHLCSVERELEARKLFSYLQYSALWLQWKHHTSLASQMPLLPVFHILMILKKKKNNQNPNQERNMSHYIGFTWKIAFQGKIHAFNTDSLSITASYLLLLISSVKGGLSRVTILLRWAAKLCKAKQKSES